MRKNISVLLFSVISVISIAILTVFLVKNSFAATSIIELSCNSNKLSLNSSLTCTIYGNGSTSKTLNGVDALITLSNNLTLESVTVDKSNWQGDGDGGHLLIYTENQYSNRIKLAEFVIKGNNNSVVGGTGTITLSNMKLSVTDKYTIDSSVGNVSTSVNFVSSDANIESISFNSKAITLEKDKYSYLYKTTNTSVPLSVTTSSGSKKTCIYNNNTLSSCPSSITLSNETNTLKIKVTSEDNLKTNEYTFTLIKYANVSYQLNEENMLIYRINLNEKLFNLRYNFDNELVEALDSNNQSVALSGIVKTGMKLKLDNKKTYTLSVIGDVSGDGLINIADVSRAYSYLKGNTQMDKCFVYAADIADNNGTVAINDISKLYSVVKNG